MKDKVFKVKSFYPPMIINISDKTYILPVWVRVPNGTTLNQIEWEKEIPTPKPQSNIIEVDSSSGGGKYQIQKIGDTYKCNCPGYYRSKDRICKHIKQIIN
jgi:hypothetical protein